MVQDVQDRADVAARYNGNGLDRPTVYLVWWDNENKDVVRRRGPRPDPLDLPALLVSYVQRDSWLAWQPENLDRYRYWILDSGVFSAKTKGFDIDVDAYTEFCLERMAEDPSLKEIISVDTGAYEPGNWKPTARNTERMWSAGVPAIPAFHFGEPWRVLTTYARDYPKVALGGLVGFREAQKIAFANACLARIWPKPIHGLGFGGSKAIMEVPFHSTDSTNWATGPWRHGSYHAYGNLPRRGATDIGVEIDWYLRLERKARFRWRREMATLEAQLGAATKGGNA